MVADKRCLALAIMDSFHDFGDGIQLEDPSQDLIQAITVLEKKIPILESKIAGYKQSSTIIKKQEELQLLQDELRAKRTALEEFRQTDTPINNRERNHIVRQTRQYIIKILKTEFDDLFNNGKYDRREKFNYYLEKYIDNQLKKDRIGLSYDKNIKNSELFMTKLFYAFVFPDRLYDAEFKLKGTESGAEYSYQNYKNHEERVLSNKTIDPIFSSADKASTWNPKPDLTLHRSYKILNLGNNVKQTGLFALPNGNELFYTWMKSIYNSTYVKYFQDANTSMPYKLLCIYPPSKVGSETPNNQSYYTGTAKSYDPGSKPPTDTEASSSVVEEPSSSKPSRFSKKQKELDIKCSFKISNLTYQLTKANGELILFDTFKFIDNDVKSYGTIEVSLKGLNKTLKTDNISKASKGVEYFKKVIYEITRNQYERAVYDRGNLDAAERKAIFMRLLTVLNNVNYEILKESYLISLDTNPAESKEVFQLTEDEYIRAIFDFKRAGDFGQVAAVQAAISYYPKEVCPIFVSLDRMAILYAIYRGVPCIYRGDTKQGDILIKCFNFKGRHPSEPIESSRREPCTPRIVDAKINEVFGDNFTSKTNNINDLDKYKTTPRCRAVLNQRLDYRVEQNEVFYRTEFRNILERQNDEIIQYKAIQGGYDSKSIPTVRDFKKTLTTEPSKSKKPMRIGLPSFGELVHIFVLNGVEIKPFDLIVLQFVMSHFA